MNSLRNTALSSEVIKLLRIIALHVKLYEAAVTKVIFKLTGYQEHILGPDDLESLFQR